MWSASEDGSVRVWDVRTMGGKCQREFSGKYAVFDAALSPGQAEIAVVDERGWLRVWEVGEKKCLWEVLLSAESDLPIALLSVAYSPDGRELATCNAKVFVYSSELFRV